MSAALCFVLYIYGYKQIKKAVCCAALLAAYLPVEHKNMNCKEEYQSDGKTAMENQNDGELIQDHAEQACGKGNHNQCKQQQAFCTQFLSVDNGVDNAEQQKQDRCQLMDMNAGQRHHDGYEEADQQSDIQQLFHTVTGSLTAGMVLTPQMK